MLGKKGLNPLICMGVNPSTASPESMDNTLKSVERISLNNDYDSWIMINLYPQRSTNPDHLHKRINNSIHTENLKYIAELTNQNSICVWAAWGALIEKRGFLKRCIKDINGVFGNNIKWLNAGQLTKKGHPRHPLYLPSNVSLTSFDIDKYLAKI